MISRRRTPAIESMLGLFVLALCVGGCGRTSTVSTAHAPGGHAEARILEMGSVGPIGPTSWPAYFVEVRGERDGGNWQRVLALTGTRGLRAQWADDMHLEVHYEEDADIYKIETHARVRTIASDNALVVLRMRPDFVPQ